MNLFAITSSTTRFNIFGGISNAKTASLPCIPAQSTSSICYAFFCSANVSTRILPRCLSNFVADATNSFRLANWRGKPECERIIAARSAKTGAFWTAERRADYRYLERLEIYDDLSHEIRKRIEKPRVQQRLQQIEARWPDWKKIQDRLTALRAKAGSSPSPGRAGKMAKTARKSTRGTSWSKA